MVSDTAPPKQKDATADPCSETRGRVYYEPRRNADTPRQVRKERQEKMKYPKEAYLACSVFNPDLVVEMLGTLNTTGYGGRRYDFLGRNVATGEIMLRAAEYYEPLTPSAKALYKVRID